jgi:hypothetical protein
MEWLVNDPRRGEAALAISALTLALCGIWLGRRRLSLAIPAALAFLLLAAVAIPSAIPARAAAQRNACIFNLRAIRDAKAQWAREHGKMAGDIVTEADLFGSNGSGGILRNRFECPRGGTYTTGAVGQNPTCSLSERGHRLE